MLELPTELLPKLLKEQTLRHTRMNQELVSAQQKTNNNIVLNEEAIVILENLIEEGRKSITDTVSKLVPFTIGRGQENLDFQKFSKLNIELQNLATKIENEIKRCRELKEQTTVNHDPSLLSAETTNKQDASTISSSEEKSFATLEQQLRNYEFQKTIHEEDVDAKKALNLILDRAVMIVKQKPSLGAQVRSCLEDTLNVLIGSIAPEEYIKKAEQRSTNLQHLGSAMLAFGALLAILCVALAPPVGAIVGGTLGLLMVAASPIPFFKGTTSVDYLDKSTLVNYVRSDKVKLTSDAQLSIDSAPEDTRIPSPGFPNQ